MKDKNIKNSPYPKWKFVRNIIITLIILGIVALVFYKAPDYVLPKTKPGIALIVNNKNLTNSDRLKNPVIEEKGVVYLSKEDISKFFDKYLYYDQKYDQYITTAGTKIATMKPGENKANINGISSNIKGSIIQRDGTTYFPISDMAEIYNIDVKKIDNKDIVIIDSLDREQIQAQTTKKLDVKIKSKIFSRTLETLEQNAKVVWISTTDNGWVKVRTENGSMGYIEEKNLTNKTTVRENAKEEKLVNGEKVSLVWDYYSQYAKVPKRQGTKIDGINVISPAFFELTKLGQGEIIDKVGTDGQSYVKWAKQNGYKVWALFNNDGMIETTTEILNDYKLRNKVIESIVSLAVKYQIDGINIDFENMYKKDKDMYSRLIIELYPRLKEKGLALSVDVTAPDGGDTWSQCFDRKTIADNADYISFMAYDQYSVGSNKAGTTAGYNWVKNNIDKFIGQEEVPKEKLLLGIPFYTRLWTEDSSGKLVGTPKTVNMKDVNNAIPSTAQRTWDELLKQYYAEYNEGANIKKIWIEDINSIREKLNLVKDYDLAGVAFWSLDRQDDAVWKEVNKIILNK